MAAPRGSREACEHSARCEALEDTAITKPAFITNNKRTIPKDSDHSACESPETATTSKEEITNSRPASESDVSIGTDISFLSSTEHAPKRFQQATTPKKHRRTGKPNASNRKPREPRTQGRAHSGSPADTAPPNDTDNPPIPIRAWDLYFSPEDYTVYNPDIQIINQIKNLLTLTREALDDIEDTRCFRCTVQAWEAMGRPELLLVSCAVSECVCALTGALFAVETRITGVPLEASFQALCPERVGEMVSVMATVSSAGFRRLENTEVYCECLKCGRIFGQRLQNNLYRAAPCTCRARSARLLTGHPGTRTVDRQDIRLQEACAYGRTAATAEALLGGLLVGSVAPGDLVVATGIVHSELVQDAYRLTLLCNDIQRLKGRTYATAGPSGSSAAQKEALTECGAQPCEEVAVKLPESVKPENLEISISAREQNEGAAAPREAGDISLVSIDAGTAKAVLSLPSDFSAFRALAEDPALPARLAACIFGAVVGHDSAKQGLLVALFGGVRKEDAGHAARAEIHVCLVGDPGVGKSRLLLAAAAVLPKSAVVSGGTCTAAGLTVSVRHDAATGEYMVDAGAAVLCDGGLCCIDEFDKLEDHHALLEAMDSQAITVAKGGVICAVPARTAVVAAANPRGGAFDAAKSLGSNVAFDAAVLTRFDLVYLITNADEACAAQAILTGLLGAEEQPPAAGRVPAGAERSAGQPALSLDMARRYIDYARNVVNPVLTRAAQEVLERYFLSIRQKRGVTMRTLETLVRLCEACARMRLRTLATAADATAAVELLSRSYMDGVEASRAKRSPEAALRGYAAAHGCFIARDRLLALLQGLHTRRSPADLVEVLNCQGVILLCANGQYKITLKP